MTVQSYDIHVSQTLYHQLERLAELRQQTIDQFAGEALQRLFAPFLNDVPERFRADLQSLATLSDNQLWQMARFERPTSRQALHQSLLAKNGEGKLSAEEEAQLNGLRDEADALLLRRSYAFLLLKQRGYAIPDPYSSYAPSIQSVY